MNRSTFSYNHETSLIILRITEGGTLLEEEEEQQQ